MRYYLYTEGSDFHEIVMCCICHTDVERASITPCGHHFCTHCITQWLDRKPSCPICKRGLQEEDLIQDRDFDQIVGHFGNSQELTADEYDSNRNQEIEWYKHELRKLKTQLQDVKEKEAENTQKVHDLQEELHNMEQQGQQLSSELTKTKIEVSCLQETCLILQIYRTRCIEQDRQLQVFQENILPEKENTISELRTDVAQISDALNAKENEIECFKDQIQDLQQYVQLCYDLSDQLKDYRENIVPEKDNTIIELRSHVEKLYDDIATLKRIPIPVEQLEALPDSNLGRAIQQLQRFYDRDYRSRYDLTDKMEALLQTRLECVMNELCKGQEIADQLALVIATYMSMVQENSNLHRSLRTKQDEVQHLKTELRQTKLTKKDTDQRLRSEE